MIRTADPTIVIEDTGPMWVVYRSLASGERWIIRGRCTACGLCEMGVVNANLQWAGEPGTPGACLDRTFEDRRDVPVRPEISIDHPACVLSGEYLPGE